MKLNRIKKSLIAAAMGAGLLLSTAVGTPAHASQSYEAKGAACFPNPCSGSVIRTCVLRNGFGQATKATYTLYYSSADNGTNCLVVRDNVAGSSYMRADICLTGQLTPATRRTTAPSRPMPARWR